MVSPGLSLLRLSAIAILTVGGILWGSPQRAFGGDLVRVRTESGRVCTGEIDAETDENLLWLRLTAPSILVKSAIRWSTIVEVSHADRQLTSAEFRPLARKLKSEIPADVFSPKATDRIETPQVESNPGKTVQPQRVQSIRIQAAAANWDGDVELDGLELWVIPVAADGSLLPVKGMLSVELIGQKHARHGRAFSEIGRWSRRARIEDYDDLRGALFRLPFRSVNPEHDLQFGWYGIVHARFGVPGHGSFEASRQVTVRTDSMLRDQLQFHTHRRFFQSERTAR